MAFPRIGGPSVGLDLATLAAYWDLNGPTTGPSFGFNKVPLQAGATWLIPSGTYQVTPGPYTQIQFRDPITNLWKSLAQTPNSSSIIGSDGYNWRLANLTGCAVGALVTDVGSDYTAAPTVTATAGASVWTAIVGGAITAAVGAGGTNYSYPPLLFVAAPPAGGIPATLTCTLSSGAINAVTAIDQGAGYNAAPKVLVINDPRDTTGSGGAITTTIAGAGEITAVVPINHGTPLSAVPTLSFSGGGGSDAAATVIMEFAATGFTVTTTGAVYGDEQPFLVITGGGIVPVAGAGAIVNPGVSTGLLTPRQANISGVSTSGGAITATGLVVNDGGLFQAIPTGFVLPGGDGLPTTTGAVTINVGGVTDVSIVQGI